MEGKKTYEELEAYIHELENKVKSKGNREYKSRLFSFIFGREENKHWTLSLYNAIHGTAYSDVSGITINTIEDVVYMGMKNDLSILVSESMEPCQTIELYEQQSSYNPNMPAREFMYAGKLYDKYLYTEKLNRYGKKLLPLPLPRLVVFYNGEEEQGDETVLRLSDAFKEGIRQNVIRRNTENEKGLDEGRLSAEVERVYQEADPDIEVKVRMVNINQGHNRKMLCECKPLGEYAWFVAQIRENLAGGRNTGEKPMGINEAIDQAIDRMPEDYEIKTFLTENRAEVKDMCLTEYNEIETREMLLQEGWKEGQKVGWKEGQIEGIIKSGRRHCFSEEMIVEDIMDATGYDKETAKKALENY